MFRLFNPGKCPELHILIVLDILYYLMSQDSIYLINGKDREWIIWDKEAVYNRNSLDMDI